MINLPNEIIFYICSFNLVKNDIFKISQINKKIKSLLYKNPLLESEIEIKSYHQLKNLYSNYTKLKKINLDITEDTPSIKFNDQIIYSNKYLNECIDIIPIHTTHLSITSFRAYLTYEIFNKICKLTNLKLLSITMFPTRTLHRNSFLLNNLKLLQKLELSHGFMMHTNFFKAICQLKNLKILDLRCLCGMDEINDDVFSEITNLKKLEKFCLQQNVLISDLRAKCLLKLNKLEYLVFGSTPENNIVKIIFGIKTLKYLEFKSATPFIDDTVSEIYKLDNLIKLEFGYQCKITDIGFKEIRKLHKLRSLDLGGDSLIYDFIGLKEMSNLQSLHFGYNSKITDTQIGLLHNLVSLTSLDLGGNSLITDKGLKIIFTFNNLRNLILRSNSKITDNGIGGIGQLSKLKQLRISAPKLTNIGIYKICQLVNVNVKLFIGELINLSNSGFSQICKLRPHFESLYLNNSRVTKSGLKNINKLQTLKVLCVKEEMITEDNLRRISGLKNVKKLYIINCQNYEQIKSIIKKVSLKMSVSDFSNNRITYLYKFV